MLRQAFDRGICRTEIGRLCASGIIEVNARVHSDILASGKFFVSQEAAPQRSDTEPARASRRNHRAVQCGYLVAPGTTLDSSTWPIPVRRLRGVGAQIGTMSALAAISATEPV
jgi:hypothetical protein